MAYTAASATSTPMNAGQAPERSFHWDIAVFKVQDEIFKVNRHALIENSEVFEGMYLLPSSGEGMSDDRPIVLEGYNAADFRALLMLLYPTMKDTISGKFPLSKEQWISALRVSRPWQMHEIRELAIKHLSRLSLAPLEKVALARDHKVSSWLIEGLTSITMGDPQLSLDALETSLGLRTAFRVASLKADLSGKATISRVQDDMSVAGFSLSALHHTNCFQPLFTTDISCRYCSRIIKARHRRRAIFDSFQD